MDKKAYMARMENQRLRFLGANRRAVRSMLKSYVNALMTDVRKASTPRDIITASEKELNPAKMTAAIAEVYLSTAPYFAKQTRKELIGKKKIDPVETDMWSDKVSAYVKQYVAKRITLITNTTETIFKNTCRAAVDKGLTEGLGINKIADMIQNELRIMERYRSERIARTETISASNYGSFEGARSTGLDLNKEWISYIDDRTRESHIDMNGQNVIMDGEFTNHLQFPGDPAGEPAEVINCRCTIGYVSADDSFDMGRPDVNALND